MLFSNEVIRKVVSALTERNIYSVVVDTKTHPPLRDGWVFLVNLTR